MNGLLPLGGAVVFMLVVSSLSSSVPGDGWLALEAIGVTGALAAARFGLPTSNIKERILLGAQYAFVLWLYLAIERIVPACDLVRFDSVLLEVDRAVFGETPALLWAQVTTPAEAPLLFELLALCYLGYHLYLHGALFWAILDEERARRLYLLFAGFAVGLAGYLAVPALGPDPALFEAARIGPLEGGPILTFTLAFARGGSSVYDVFPSLHAAIALIVLLHDHQHHRVRFWVALPFVLVLLVSTLALRFHYAIDVAAGVVMAIVVVAWARRVECASGSWALEPGPKPEM